MKVLNDYQCNLGHITERFIDSSIETIECPFCLGEAHKVLSSPSYFKIDGFRADIMSDKWAITREKNAKRAKEHGEA